LHSDPKVAEEVAYSAKGFREEAVLDRKIAAGDEPLAEVGWFGNLTDEEKRLYKGEEAKKIDKTANSIEWDKLDDIKNRNK
ncbi:MAG: hypothetical protein WAZ50_01810, partial [Minisyncoccia bacterium]